jgi:chitinase
MKKLIILIFTVFILTNLFGDLDKRIIGYFISWGVYGRDFHITDIPVDKITHINYAFANINSETLEIMLGDAYADIDKYYPGDSWEPGSLRGSFHQLQILKDNHPDIKTLISVGGWTWSTYFSLVAETETTRQNFAASCVEFIQEYEFDGVDIDWEYPVAGGSSGNYYSPDDAENFVLLLEELRSQLDDAGDYLLTVATPAGPDKIANHDLAGMEPYLDWFNIMTYDFHGPWGGEGDAVTGHLSALYYQENDPLPPPYNTSFNADAAVQAYLSEGVPADKIQLGIPFYGRGYNGVSDVNNGLYQTWTSPCWFGTWENSVFDYYDLRQNYEDSNGYLRYWDNEAKSAWLYSSQSQVMITYEDAYSAMEKADYVCDNELGGVMFWEFSADWQDELLDAVYNVFDSNEDVFYGDINEDGEITAFDASIVLQYIVGLDPLPEIDPLPWSAERIERADVDGNDSIEAYDASLILRFVVGMINQFPVEY